MSEKDRLNLLSIIEAIEKIESYTLKINDADDFVNDKKSFDACLMNFIIIGEMVARLSDKFMEKYDDIQWNKIKALRNIAAHDYFGVDAEEVWQIIRAKIPDLKSDLNELLLSL